MKIAINNLSYVNKLQGNEIIYVFNKEPLKDLLKTKLHCIHRDYIEGVDINLTNYEIPCIKKCTINDDLNIPPKRDYKFAIIIPNYNNDHGEYNGKTYLQNCIESVLNQTYKDFELIIVDDMSTDTSVQTIQKYTDKRIHLIQNNRKRYNGGSRNVGIDKAKELKVDYICFIDSDDWWKHDKVLEHINKKLYNHEMMILCSEMLFPNNVTSAQYNKYDNYEDVYFCHNKVWCTAWSRVVRIDKIVYFCESTLMEDRVWSYRQADNIEYSRIININEIVYVWNRLNTDNSVSLIRGGIWDASAWCHIGHQLQFLEEMKHTEFKDKLEQRIRQCISKANMGIYQQF